MPLSLIPSFIFYLFITAITPGPANLTSLSTAMRHGKKAALRQWRGIYLGFMTVSVCSAFLTYIVGTALIKYVDYFSFIGAAYIVWLAYHIWKDEGADEEEGDQTDAPVKQRTARIKEGTFLYGMMVQLTNVKVMIMCITALAAFVLPYSSDLGTLLLVAVLLPFSGPVCNLAWLFAGVQLQAIFRKHRKLLNGIMAASLVLCAVSMVI